jgi:hypothetical protein
VRDRIDRIRTLPASYADSISPRDRVIWRAGVVPASLILWSGVMLWLCWKGGGLQLDYDNYVVQWQLLLDGSDPWSTDNAYGPLHTALGVLLPWGLLVPKFFMIGLMLVANAALLFELMRQRGTIAIQVTYLLAVPTNMLLIGMGVIYGSNDVFVAGLLVIAVLLRHGNHLIAAGALVGLAALTKYYPLLLLPFFALDEGRLRWSVIASGMAVFLFGFIAAVGIWGHGPIASILYGSSRGPKLLSILAAMQSLFGDAAIINWLVRYSTYLVLSGVAAAFVFAWRSKINFVEGVVLGYLVMLTLYKTGHQQFYIAWLFMVACLPLAKKTSADHMAIILWPLVLLLSLYQFGYQFGDNYRHVLGWVRSYGGFVAFAVSVASVAACVAEIWRNRGQANLTPSAIAVPSAAVN